MANYKIKKKFSSFIVVLPLQNGMKLNDETIVSFEQDILAIS